MARNPIWKTITATLTSEIADGHYRPGDKLPTEAELSARFGVNRHTVRRAIAALAEAGLTHSQRGSGVFVTAKPTDYPLGRRVRFHQSLQAAGQIPDKRTLRIEVRLADPREAEALQLPEGASVSVYESLSFADGAPMALARSLFPTARFPDILTHLQETNSVTEALRRSGLDDYTRISTRLTAKAATATQATHLRIPEGAPILRSVGINVDAENRPVEYGQTWFAGDRVTLTISPDD